MKRADPHPWDTPYPGAEVWGGKVGRRPREAVVAGALACAHALERHPGSLGSIPCGWNTSEGLKTASLGPGCRTSCPHDGPAPAGALPLTPTFRQEPFRTSSPRCRQVGPQFHQSSKPSPPRKPIQLCSGGGESPTYAVTAGHF